VPASLWLAFFYLHGSLRARADALRRSACSVLGALVAAPLADFVDLPARPPQPLGPARPVPFAPDRVVHAVAVVGLAQELCKYVAVRYTIYTSPEFDEPMDGVVYMMSVGTGFAVWVNYHRLSGPGRQGLPVDRRRRGGDHHPGPRVVRRLPRLRARPRQVHAPRAGVARRPAVPRAWSAPR
jgi:hypothetical protein